MRVAHQGQALTAMDRCMKHVLPFLPESIINHRAHFPQVFALRAPDKEIVSANQAFMDIAGLTSPDALNNLDETRDVPWSAKLPQLSIDLARLRTSDDNRICTKDWYPTHLGWRLLVSKIHLEPNGFITNYSIDLTEAPIYQRWLNGLDLDRNCIDLGAEFDHYKLSAERIKVLRLRLLGLGWQDIETQTGIKQRTAREWVNQFKGIIMEHAHLYQSLDSLQNPAIPLKMTHVLQANGLGWFLVGNDVCLRQLCVN